MRRTTIASVLGVLQLVRQEPQHARIVRSGEIDVVEHVCGVPCQRDESVRVELICLQTEGKRRTEIRVESDDSQSIGPLHRIGCVMRLGVGDCGIWEEAVVLPEIGDVVVIP